MRSRQARLLGLVLLVAAGAVWPALGSGSRDKSTGGPAPSVATTPATPMGVIVNKQYLPPATQIFAVEAALGEGEEALTAVGAEGASGRQPRQAADEGGIAGPPPPAPIYSDVATPLANGFSHGTFVAADNLHAIGTGVLTEIQFTVVNFAPSVLTGGAAEIVLLNESPGSATGVLDTNSIFATIPVDLTGINLGANGGSIVLTLNTVANNITIPRQRVWAGLRFLQATFAGSGAITNLGQRLYHPPTIGGSANSFFLEGNGFVFFGATGPFSNFGWRLTTSAVNTCTVQVPSGAIEEPEACSANTNGGCNSTPNVFEMLPNCNVKVHGTTWAMTGTRDTDWFEFQVAQAGPLDISVTANNPVTVSLVNDQCGTGLMVIGTVLSDTCLTGTASFNVQPGTYRVVVAGPSFFGFPCGTTNDYVLEIACTPPNLCVGDINGDGARNFDDILAIIFAFGFCIGCPEDVNNDGLVNFDDVLVVIFNYGACP